MTSSTSRGMMLMILRFGTVGLGTVRSGTVRLGTVGALHQRYRFLLIYL